MEDNLDVTIVRVLTTSFLRPDIVYFIQDNARDVLEDHRIRNRPNKPPQPERLAFSAAHQKAQGNEIANEDEEHHSDNGDNEEEGEEDSDEEVTTRKRRRHSPKPDQLNFYPETWQKVLKDAKLKYRLHVFNEHGFPEQQFHLADVNIIIVECIAAAQDKGILLDNGE